MIGIQTTCGAAKKTDAVEENKDGANAKITSGAPTVRPLEVQLQSQAGKVTVSTLRRSLTKRRWLKKRPLQKLLKKLDWLKLLQSRKLKELDKLLQPKQRESDKLPRQKRLDLQLKPRRRKKLQRLRKLD